jgi:hypothetical protein
LSIGFFPPAESYLTRDHVFKTRAAALAAIATMLANWLHEPLSVRSNLFRDLAEFLSAKLCKISPMKLMGFHSLCAQLLNGFAKAFISFPFTTIIRCCTKVRGDP